MGRLIVIQFITLDGVVEDPDGSDQSAFGGWAMRHGPQGVAGDKFRLGPILEQGTLLFGRRTWEHFSSLWPHRDDPFSQAMNAADKAVVTHRQIDPATWSNSRVIDRSLIAWVRHHVATTDLVVIGSHSVVDELARAGLVDEYRLLIFPTAVGSGRRLFTERRELELVSAEQIGPAVLTAIPPVLPESCSAASRPHGASAVPPSKRSPIRPLRRAPQRDFARRTSETATASVTTRPPRRVCQRRRTTARSRC